MVLCTKDVKYHAYRLDLVQKVTWTEDQAQREQSALEMVSSIEEDRAHLSKFVF
jgi:hypothetical protein